MQGARGSVPLTSTTLFEANSYAEVQALFRGHLRRGHVEVLPVNDMIGIRKELEEGPNGNRVTRQLDKIWEKYTGNEPPYGLRDPSIDEKRVLFVCRVDRIATFGKP